MAVDLEANKAVVRRLFEEGFNAGRLEVVDELVAPDVVTTTPSFSTRRPDRTRSAAASR
jgi:ketosteroid isomerase-like protein